MVTTCLGCRWRRTVMTATNYESTTLSHSCTLTLSMLSKNKRTWEREGRKNSVDVRLVLFCVGLYTYIYTYDIYQYVCACNFVNMCRDIYN